MRVRHRCPIRRSSPPCGRTARGVGSIRGQSAGPYLRARRRLAWVLIAIFTLLPYARMNGKPAVLLDLPHREFTVLGFTFLSTDTLLLALALIT